MFTTISLIAWLVITIVIAIAEIMRRKRVFFLLIKKYKKGKIIMALPAAIKNLIGKTVKLKTLNASYKGKIDEVEDEWVKIVDKDGGEFFVREDMIMAISVKPATNN